MTCEEFQASVDAFIDNASDPQQARLLASHEATCPACHNLAESRRAGARAIATHAARRPAPAALREAILGSIVGAADSTPAPSPVVIRRITPRWAWVALAASLLLAASTAWLGAYQLGWTQPRAARVAREAIAAHVAALMSSHIADVASTDRHTVKPWFAGKIDFSPPVVDLAADGFPLTGGRLDTIHHRSAAVLIFTRRAHTIALFVWPQPGPPATIHTLEDRGYHAVEWSSNTMRFCAVSELNTEELTTFVRLYREAVERSDR